MTINQNTWILFAAVTLAACGGKDENDPMGTGTGVSVSTTASTDGTATQGTTSDDPTATTATTTGTATDGGTAGDSGSPFIEEPDGGGGSIECDIWAQDCPMGEKCMPWANDGGTSWNATKCSPLKPNPQQPGDPCTVEGNGVSGIDDCDISAMCWNVDPQTNMGYCVDFCKGTEQTPSCDDPGTACTIYNNGVLPLCLPLCDPLIQDCGNMDVCVQTATGDNFVCVLDASGAGGMYGDPCEYVNVCDPGLFCANAVGVPGCQGSIGCCTEFCDLTAANPASVCSGAAMGVECVPYFAEGQAPPGHDDVGGCIIPQ